ncbi:molybdopterin cofactor-binding domain-containing protein [Bradyrhizobium liaoningense]|uniref:xanthine dehydrogenase family protein molybdopterin-binding subunit n=1 Tax=Bradyrhizobium liaoningense TaxID=43992 RepID=UPI001BA585AB|nr:molybdopterin cofactor-binding domain-containing protein [Bradyrhizobium liaoningense]MBR0714214.1 xanthine dehydrogenase family protein molybdopterin-binding subunit [Bradyrhizobium liaoningense]
MSTSLDQLRISRRAVLKGGALTVGFALTVTPGAALAQAVGGVSRRTDATQVDAYLAVNGDGTVTLYCGKVDLGQGLRIAIPQIAAEELGIGVDRIKYIEGDTALTPNQGRTSGSTGIQRGGMQIRQAAATARKALVDLAAQRLNLRPDDLIAADGEVRPKAGGDGIRFADLLDGRKFDVKLDPKAPLKDPASYTVVGKSLPRPDVAAKCLGTATYIHDLTLPDMLHARVIRPPAIGATLVAVDEGSIKDLAGARVVRLKDFLAVVADDEWTTVRAARSLRAQWSEASNLPVQDRLTETLRTAAGATAETLVTRGTPPSAQPQDTKTLSASYFWPMQSHASLGPSCAVADVRTDEATIWTASQGMHDNRVTYARFLGLPLDKVRLIYLEGSGCYGMNGHEDAAADAAILSRAMGRPVRVQWSRADELGWDPKGPPQLLDLSGSVDAEGRILDWRTEMWIPQTTKGLLNIPLLGPQAAGLDNVVGLNTGLISQNGDPPYEAAHMQVVVHWLKETPLRPAPLRSPGKPANCFAVESFIDELAAAARLDPVAFRLRGLKNPRGVELIKRVAAMMKWEPRASPGPNIVAAVARGRGMSYIHYKHSETFVAMGMEVAVEQASGRIQVERVVCAHDCGQMINPDGVRSQVEGSILQTISRVLMEEVKFDRSRVTSVDWTGYPILRFSDVPRIEIDLVDRPTEPPLGAGEAACAAVGAALANAVFDATGLRLRTVPFTPERVKAVQNSKAI